MRLKTLIAKLEKERLKFKEKNGCEPLIFDFGKPWVNGDDLEMELTSKVEHDGCARIAYTQTFKIKNVLS